MDIESTLNSLIFFPSIKNGEFDYSTPMKSSLIKFDLDKTIEPSQNLFEYLCYKIVKKKILEGQINSETVLITDKFLTSFNCKKVFIKAKAIHKKNILIFLQNKNTSKWNLIAFLNLEEQLKNCFEENNKQPIIAKIISSNTNSDEDDYILNSTMDKLENTFDFKSPDDIQFEVDSINISDQPNTCIFLLNFIEGLIVQNDENLPLYIKRLYDEGCNTTSEESKNYFTSFNRINEDFENIYIKYQNELNEYCKKNKNNIINFDAEKIMNGNNEIFNIENNKESYQNRENDLIIEENGSPDQSQIVNGMDKNNLNNNRNNTQQNKMKDEIDMIQIEQDDEIDDDLNSDEEEEALKIMERQSEETKNKINQERKLRQRQYKQKLRLKNINMYKEFGVIKEEDNESESESIDYFGKMKEEKENLNENTKKSLKKIIEERKSKKSKKNSSKSSSENIPKIILSTDSNNNNELKKEIIINKENNDLNLEEKSQSEKGIKLSVLRDLEEAIEEFELEVEPTKGNKEKSINSNKTKKNDNKNNFFFEARPIEKKVNVKSENVIEENNKKEKKYINVFKENTDIKKISSMTKSKEKEISIEEILNKNGEKLKKSFTNTKKPEKEKIKEKTIEGLLIKNIKGNSLAQKKPNSIKENNKSNKSSKSNSSINSYKSKEQDNSIASNNNVYNTNSFNSNSNSSKSNNDQEKYPKDKEKENNINKKAPTDNVVKKNLNNIINNDKKTIPSKNKNIKKTNSKKNIEKASQPTLINKTSNSSQKSSSTNKSGDTNSKSNGEKNSNKNKKKSFKEIEIKMEKSKITDFSAVDNPMSVLPPQKIVERNSFYDLNEKEKMENGSSLSYKSSQNIDINSVKSDKIIGDNNSNINIENIFTDDFESEKDKNEKFETKDDGSILGERRIKKSMMLRKADKKTRAKVPPGKSRAIPRTYNDYCNFDEDGTKKICGCIGEQSNGICSIF